MLGVNYKRAKISTSTTGAALVAAVTAKKIQVMALIIMGDGDTDVTLNSASTALTGAMPLAVSGNGLVVPFCGVPWLETVAGEALTVTLSAAVAISGCLVYLEE